MREALSARYPADTFTVRDVTLTVIPPGAKATARAEHEGLDFDVRPFRISAKETGKLRITITKREVWSIAPTSSSPVWKGTKIRSKAMPWK